MQIDLEPLPKTIEGKATRVATYEPWWFWYCGSIGALWVIFGLYAFDWNWRLALAFTMPGLLLGGVLGIRFRNTP
jgi:hypothetical protein